MVAASLGFKSDEFVSQGAERNLNPRGEALRRANIVAGRVYEIPDLEAAVLNKRTGLFRRSKTHNPA